MTTANKTIKIGILYLSIIKHSMKIAAKSKLHCQINNCAKSIQKKEQMKKNEVGHVKVKVHSIVLSMSPQEVPELFPVNNKGYTKR